METNLTLDALLEMIHSEDPEVRTEGWMRAGEVGAEAVRPLAGLMAETAPIVNQLARELARLEIAGGDAEARARISAKQEELRASMELGKAAKRGLWKLVRHACRPDAPEARRAVLQELMGLVRESRSLTVRRDGLWMLVEVGGDEAVDTIAEMLDHEELRDEARQALERIPGERSLAVLQKALATTPEEFRIRVAQSVRARGVEAPGLPGQRLVPLQAD
jgi:hypothetical protein